MAIPSLQATVSGSRPPTGSGLLQGYTTALLQHVPASDHVPLFSQTV